MVALQIYSLDDENENTIIATFFEGDHPIGRDKLNCKDKRVSRNHAMITVTYSDVILKSTHVNPLFYKAYGGNSIKIVKTNETVIIHDGDQFGFLVDAFWFKTRFSESKSGIKRPCYEVEVNKRLKTSCKENRSITENDILKSSEKGIDSDKNIYFAHVVVDSNEQNKIHVQDIPSAEDENNQLEKHAISNPGNVNLSDQDHTYHHTDLNENQEFTDVSGKSNKQENEMFDANKTPMEKTCQREESSINKPYKNETVTDHAQKDLVKHENDDTEMNNSNNNDTLNRNDTPMKKQKCWYGANCYRKSMEHKQKYSHPGDPDYDENDIPHCPFGSTCYRKNILHRQHYQHTNAPVQKLSLNTNVGTSYLNNSDNSTNGDTSARTRRKTASTMTKDADSSDNDYDLEDPFINDGSSDDFELTDSDDSDSDWQDSQEVEENPLERKRLLKEAKKITKGKK